LSIVLEDIFLKWTYFRNIQISGSKDLAQHKGKEFDEPFYRQVISPNVIEFLGLKDEMEDVVALKRRSKVHGAVGTDNELNAAMKKLRDEEVNRFRKGRTHDANLKGHMDDFTQGFEALKKTKVKDFITKSSIFSTVLKMHAGGPGSNELPTDVELEEELDEINQLNKLEDDHQRHPRMVAIDGILYMTQSAGKLGLVSECYLCRLVLILELSRATAVMGLFPSRA
jgi:hypothetical protein